MRHANDYLSTAEAARIAGVATTRVKRWADEGILRCLRTAEGERRFLRSDVDAFLKSQASPALLLERKTGSAQQWLSLFHSAEIYPLVGALFSARGRLGAWYRVAEELGDALTLLGEKWECGETSVFEEHLASARLHRGL